MNARPISALLSQALVAFTVELDNEFERRMIEAGYPGARFSLVLWSNLMRFMGEDSVSVRELAKRTLVPEAGIKFQLGSLERWGLVLLGPESGGHPAPLRRDGWGSGRGVRAGWIVELTKKGRAACDIWRGLPEEVEERWKIRFGVKRIERIREAAECALGHLKLDLPEGVPLEILGTRQYPQRSTPQTEYLQLPSLLSQLLLAFASEFDRECFAPLQLCANTLRVLGETPVPVSDLPRLTGCSPETCGLGWQLKKYVAAGPDAVAKRGPAAKPGKVVRLTALGVEAQRQYQRLAREIESRWSERFGAKVIADLRASIEELFDLKSAGKPLLAEGLAPPAGTVRAGVLAPALGRRDIGAAARQRMRDLVAQTGWFLADPATALPHYPLWDHNRGFGP